MPDLRLVRLPAYGPDINPGEHLWGWVRQEVTAATCSSTAAIVRAHVNTFFAGLAARTEEVQQRCGTIPLTLANALGASQLGDSSEALPLATF